MAAREGNETGARINARLNTTLPLAGSTEGNVVAATQSQAPKDITVKEFLSMSQRGDSEEKEQFHDGGAVASTSEGSAPEPVVDEAFLLAMTVGEAPHPDDPPEPGPALRRVAEASTSTTSPPAAASSSAKREAQKRDDSNPALTKKKRKSYSDIDKQRVIEANARGGRKEYLAVARVLGMPVQTADNLINRARCEGESAGHDRRHDAATHTGAYTKQQPWQKEMLKDLLHFNSTLTNKELMIELNREVVKRLLKANGAEEIAENTTLVELEKKLEAEHPSVWQAYMRHSKIKGPETIRRWLINMVITRKHTITEKTSVNEPANMARRLQYARALRKFLDDSKFYFVFIDEMPFYLTMRRSFGRAPKGERAVVKTPPQSNMAFRTQLAMAVNPDYGLICGNVFAPKQEVKQRSEGSNDSKPKRKSWVMTWNRAQYLGFLNDVVQSLIERRRDVEGKTVIIVVDGAPEHGKEKDFTKMLHELPSYPNFKDTLGPSGAELRMLKAPPNSPQLNLCEYYNRWMRSKVQAVRNSCSVEKLLLDPQQPGAKVEAQVNLLEMIVKECLEELTKQPAFVGSVVTMLKFLDMVIEQNGYLDMHKPM